MNRIMGGKADQLENLVNDCEKLENELLDNPNVTICDLAERREHRDEARKLIKRTRR